MKLFKLIRFWLVWGLAAPFVLLYLNGTAAFSGQWKLIYIKIVLIQTGLYQKFVANKHIAVKGG